MKQVIKNGILNSHRLYKQINRHNLYKLIYHLKTGNLSLIKEKLGIYYTNIDVLKLDLIEDIIDYQPLEFSIVKNPKVSIIIPVYNQWDFTYKCLKSILNHTHDIDYEIIIADDVSSDDTMKISELIQNIKVVRNEKNLGFLLNCNNASRYASGEYIHFLNNDTQVEEGWLSSLMELIESDQTIGMVGSKLVYPDGRLQEAGGIIWDDASGWNYGRLDDPMKPEYNYVKEVDFISGASIMIRSSLWNKIGGFDTRYVPAYYEDADLAFEVRRLGYKVMYQPKSIVVHFEGISNGTDLGSGIKKYQVINHEKFFTKWKETLKNENFQNAENVFQARDRSRDKKVLLFIDHYIPHFDQDAGSRATLHYLDLFLKNNINVKFLGDNFYHYPETIYLSTLEQMGIEVLHGTHYEKNWKTWIQDNGNSIDYIVLSRPHISKKYIDFLKEYTNAKIIYFAVDLHYLREQREYQIKKEKSILESSKYWKQVEFDIMLKSDISCFYSHVEVDEIKKENSDIKAIQVPLYIFDKFPEITYSHKERQDIMFVGGFGHNPNIDAVIWFLDEVMPKIKQTGLLFNFYIVGSNIPKSILSYAEKDKNIIITGRISDEELNKLYSTCRLSIAPLRYGAGMKGKVVESLYNGIPLVTTSIGAEGLQEIQDAIKITDDAVEFAKYVVEIYQNETLGIRLAEESSRYCKKYFSLQHANECIFNRGIDLLNESY